MSSISNNEPKAIRDASWSPESISTDSSFASSDKPEEALSLPEKNPFELALRIDPPRTLVKGTQCREFTVTTTVETKEYPNPMGVLTAVVGFIPLAPDEVTEVGPAEKGFGPFKSHVANGRMEINIWAPDMILDTVGTYKLQIRIYNRLKFDNQFVKKDCDAFLDAGIVKVIDHSDLTEVVEQKQPEAVQWRKDELGGKYLLLVCCK